MSDPVPNRLSEPMPTPNQLGSEPAGQPSEPSGRRRRARPPTRRETGAGCGTALAIVIGLAMSLGGSAVELLFDGGSPGQTVESVATQPYEVGQCLDVTTYDPEAGQEVDTVDLVILSSCAGLHDGEVIAVPEMPAAPDGTYPRVIEFDQFAGPVCDAAFSEYLGVPADAGFPFQWSFMFQWEEAWGAGDHTIVCYLERFDEAEWSGLAKDAVVRPSGTP